MKPSGVSYRAWKAALKITVPPNVATVHEPESLPYLIARALDEFAKSERATTTEEKRT